MKISEIPSPSFVLEEQKLLENLNLIQSVQRESGVDIILALKAFAMWPIFPVVRKYLSGATASSLSEARLIFEKMGCKAHTYSPAYFEDELNELLNYSSHITFNSLAQFERFKGQVLSSDGGISIGLRVNPEYSDVAVALYNPADPASRLGETAPNFEQLPTEIEGLHIHTLCESSSYAFEKVLEAFIGKFGKFLPQLKWVNFGGGHLMTRTDYDVNHLVEILKNFKLQYPHLQIIMEPGSAVVWETGFLRSTVMDIIENHGVHTAILDVSFTAHMPDTLEMPYRPNVQGNVPAKTNTFAYRLGGISCLAGDFLEAYHFDQPLKVGDPIILDDMIHYTMVKTTMFNGVRHPNIAVLHENGDLEILRKFGYEDFKNRLA